MSKLDDLIKEYCPNGVEYKKLGDVVDFYEGYAFKKNELSDSGTPVIRTTDLQRGTINVSNSLKYDGATIPNKYTTHYGDVLIGMSGSIKIARNTYQENCF